MPHMSDRLKARVRPVVRLLMAHGLVCSILLALPVRAADVAAPAVPSAPSVPAASAGPAVVPMTSFDPDYDKKGAAEIALVRAQLVELGRQEAKLLQVKRPSKAAITAIRERLEAPRNRMADLAVDAVAQIEIAEALGRTEQGDARAVRYRKDFNDTLWRIDWRAKSFGDARADATLGALYRLGLVAERNEAKSCLHYRRAAGRGHVAAQYRAMACEAADSAEARRWRDLAAEGGHPLAQELRGRECLRERRDAQCALTWLGRAAEQQRAGAVSLLGWMYLTGELVPRDDRRAFDYSLDAALLGDRAAANNLGQLYEIGRGTAVNGEEAFNWYKRAAEAGLGSAQVNLARAYIEGRGTVTDKAAAKVWLERARQQGIADAAKLLDWLAAQ